MPAAEAAPVVLAAIDVLILHGPPPRRAAARPGRYTLPSTLAAPDRYGDLIPPVARAWMDWLMDRRALDKPARRQIRRQLDATLRRFPAVWNDPLQSPMRRYVQDLPDEVICDGTRLAPVPERREFAVPVPSDRASGTVAGKPGRRARDVTTLDRADPVDRQLITVNDPSAR